MSKPITVESIIRSKWPKDDKTIKYRHFDSEEDGSIVFEDVLDKEKRKIRYVNAQETLHLDRFKEVVKALDEKEVELACKIFAKEHPVEMLAALNNYICGMANTYKSIEVLVKEMNDV